MAKRMEEWDAGQFYVAFRETASKAPDEHFKSKLNALAEAIEPLQREFERETVKCAVETASLMEDLQWIAAKMGYCERPRGFERECEELDRRLSQTVEKVGALRESCFI